MIVSKSIGSPLLVKDSEVVEEVSEDKKAIPEIPLKSNAGSGHIVYVRRKHETELAKSNISETQINDAVDNTVQGKTTQQHVEMNCVSDVLSLERVSSPNFSSTRCSSVSPTLGMSRNISSQGIINVINVNNNIHVKCTNSPPSDDPMLTMNFKLWEERYCRLQSLLKMLDESDQDDYVQMLRSLSSVELSRHAVELEKRSIKLSLEEAKELQRVRLFDVLGKYPNNVATPFTQQGQLHK
ncbi:hypothetical protein ACJIZ3_000723 [Penstemon smallii]|uniref:Uncharacterized protein n=1 Tax=Penstemon smallii TaxID=265156 RepID=A0ABD3U218_9LAMI